MGAVNKYVDQDMSSAPMTQELRKAVKQALAAQDGMIYPGKELPVQRFLEKPKPRAKFNFVRNGKPMTYASMWSEKNRNGFKTMKVSEYCNFLALLEQDELEPK